MTSYYALLFTCLFVLIGMYVYAIVEENKDKKRKANHD